MPLNNQRVESASSKLLATSGILQMVAAPGAGKFIRVIEVQWISITASATVTVVSDGSGGAVLFEFPVSLAAGNNGRMNFGDGRDLTENTALMADPTAAGPEISFVTLYQIVTFK